MANARDNSNNAGALCVIIALPTRVRADGAVELPQKLIDGSAAYARQWPGRVVVFLEPGEPAYANLDNVWVKPEELPFGLEMVSFDDEAALSSKLRGARMALVALHHRLTHFAKLCADAGVPCVYTAEYSLKTRFQIVRATARLLTSPQATPSERDRSSGCFSTALPPGWIG